MTEAIPHFTTFGKNYVRRFAGTEVFEKIFNKILCEAVDAGFVDACAVFIDATHIKASANNHKYTNEIVAATANTRAIHTYAKFAHAGRNALKVKTFKK